jgi:hypothetical protein
METPRPTDEHRRLAALAGEWEGGEVIHAPLPDGAVAAPTTGRFHARVVADGFFLATDYEQRRGDAVTYRGHGVYGYDPSDGVYLMYWFDESGHVPLAPVVGRFKDGTWTYEVVGPQGPSRYVYEVIGPAEFAFRIETTNDATTWTPFMEGRYRRRLTEGNAMPAGSPAAAAAAERPTRARRGSSSRPTASSESSASTKSRKAR